MALIKPLAVLEPLINLIDNENIRESLSKTAQIYFSGITVSLIPSIIIGLLSVVGFAQTTGSLLYIWSGARRRCASVDGKTSTSYGKVYSRNADYFDQTIADLQKQVAQLQESHQSLGDQIYYSSESIPTEVNTNQIGNSSYDDSF